MRDDLDAGTLDHLLSELARFTAPGAGVTRLAYDFHWLEAHRWLRAEAAARGLAATADAAGNLLFHDPSWAPGERSRPVLAVGSHLDSVREGGRYDGAYGTIAGLLLAARHRGRPGPPVVGFVTCEEEQSRFGSHMMGARSLLGLIGAAELDAVRDGNGVTWRQALAAAAAAGCAAPLGAGDRPVPPLFRAAIALELHIEQGPVLESEGLDLGIVEHIAGYRRLRAGLTGAARHSGTTPPPLRRDALAASAEIVLAAESLAREAGEPARVTAGNARVSPGLYNVVPGACEIWLEVRHADPGALGRLASLLEERSRDIARRRGIEIVLEEISRQEPTPLSAELAARAESLAREQGLRHRRMASGAAHDCMEFARAGVPALMLFVPSRGGISHAPDEYTSPEHLERGLTFAGELIDRLTREGSS